MKKIRINLEKKEKEVKSEAKVGKTKARKKKLKHEIKAAKAKARKKK